MSESGAEFGAQRTPRRNFLERFLGVVFAGFAGTVLYPVIRFLSPPRIPEATSSRVLAGRVSELSDTNWKVFPFGSEPAILIRTEAGEYRAFSATCTHLSCTVQYDDRSERIWCACHNGWFDMNGKNVAGPPPRPLQQYKTNVVGDDIFVLRG